jgi:phosphatidylinositol glycan class W
VLYACATRDKKSNPILDFTTMVLPLLLGVTAFSERPYTFNAFILALAGYLFTTSRSTSRHLPALVEKQKERSKGEWLDESDSDEELAEPLPSASLSLSPQPVSATSSGISIGPPSNPSPSMLVPETPTDQKARKRRHSPTPSTHNHMAIDILPTPELAGPGILSSQQSSYPSPLAARLRQAQAQAKGRLPFLSVYRAHMMVMTIHCILAVDFSIFPRTQGKCESFGTSLVSFCFRSTLMCRWTWVWGLLFFHWV